MIKSVVVTDVTGRHVSEIIYEDGVITDWKDDIAYDTKASVDWSRPLIPKLCKCCNAPLKSNKCEYCGVEYA